ncbi:MAG: cysteine dioxygenase [Planctomycetota bacterium]|jgi:cysteine dioxygenase
MNPAAAPNVTVDSFPKLRSLFRYLDRLGRQADLATLHRLLAELDITRADLAPACRFEADRYQRNLIKETSWYELVCLCWQSGQRTPIHDHAGSSCAFLVVEGVATETRFDRTPSGLICPTWTKDHEPGYVCASDEADIHQVANTRSVGEDLITLHAYSPRLRSFNIFTLDTPTAADPASVRRNTEVGVKDLNKVTG